jgi:hypothetical protein
LNLMASLALTWKAVTSPEIPAFNKYRNAHGLTGHLPLLSAPTRAAHIICPAIRETDFPLSIPDNLALYGPIILDSAPIEVSDPELNHWLEGGETVLMCMGTHFHYSESQVRAVIQGFLNAVPHGSNAQFLWKLSNKPDFENVIEEVLNDPMNKERFKIVEWLEADPVSIMKHKNVVAWVHHGGANSYFEGTL